MGSAGSYVRDRVCYGDMTKKREKTAWKCLLFDDEHKGWGLGSRLRIPRAMEKFDNRDADVGRKTGF